jgi:hypothetical protein
MPDRWHALVLDQSTPDDALKILGKPDKDVFSSGPLKVDPISHWLSTQKHEKGFRVLLFKHVEDMKMAQLTFLDGKLVSISLFLAKDVSPEALASIYRVKFDPAIRALDIAFAPQDYEHNQGKIYPKSFPVVYHMVGVSDKSFISAMVANVPSFGRALGQTMGIPDTPGSLPGAVKGITLVSRVMENRDNSNALK